LEGLLIARHRIIDSTLDDLIQGGVSQVIEAACGMSPRGWRFSERYGERLTYVEADLPAMARRKRDALARMGSLSERHRVASSTSCARAARAASSLWPRSSIRPLPW
jgi:O-methyltransferase involved in polyketide biosynthesis